MKRVKTTVEPAVRSEGPIEIDPRAPLGLTAISLGGVGDAGIPIAAARAGYLGLLDLSDGWDPLRAVGEVDRMQRLGRGRVGVILAASDRAMAQLVVPRLREEDTVVIAIDIRDALSSLVEQVRGRVDRVGCVLYSVADARPAEAAGVDFVMVKGNEAGGRVGDLTAFVFVQQVLRECALPVIAWGGIGPSTAAACFIAGAQGVALDWQLSLLKESPLGEEMKARIRRMDGSECPAVRFGDDQSIRLYHQPAFSAYPAIARIAADTDGGTPSARMDRGLRRPPDSDRLEDQVWLAGQDACIAAKISDAYPSVGRYLTFLAGEARRLADAATGAGVLGRGSPMARALGTTYPVIQGPMTRVSDVPEFCAAVAAGGGLPFLALALVRAPGVREMMARSRELLGDRPWGVGILGFVPKALRDEQLAVVEEIRPPFAIIAGGRPDQAVSLEAKGIATFLHVPSPGMLRVFLEEGARRFIFEGAECGGHVGPRSSFVLWESMVAVLAEADLSPEETQRIEVFFAGGIHDAVSAAMAATVAQPLVERGMRFGVVMGTAYLFTKEAISTGAIVPEFQAVALDSRRTVLVETGPGHAIRCAPTRFYDDFERRKRELLANGMPPAEVREELERSNMGRLRVASKAIARCADPVTGEVKYIAVDLPTQRKDGMYMIGQVASQHERVVTIRELHEDVFDGGEARLREAAERPLLDTVVASPAPEPFDVAIVGMSCLLPGGATNVDRFWENILAKRDAIDEVPTHRFDASLWFDEDRAARDRIYSKWGGFIEDLPFDPLKYGIPPSALRSIEPMQLLALELVDQALRDAGYRDDNPYRERTSVILGAGGGAAELGGKYAFRSMLPEFADQIDPELLDQLPEWTEDSFAGILLNVIAGRITNRFDLGGCNFTVDAACASSLAAVYLGCRELASRTSDMVICGGCDTIQSPFGYLCFSKTGALSPRGRSCSFDADADGIAISEGHAAVVLKRREDAERDGDTIYAVIRGVAGGSDGKSMGLTAPRLEGQLRTLRRAYAQARFSPASIGIFEAHATGTRVGDQTECLAIARLLEENGARGKSVGIGGVKSTIGHTKCAAGTAGLIKMALALHHRVLPPTLHVNRPNPKAGLVGGPLYVNTETRPWIVGAHSRRAGVSAFGFGGSNFHAVLEEYADVAVPHRRAAPRRERTAELFAFSADSPREVAAAVSALSDEVRAGAYGDSPGAMCSLAYGHFVRGSRGRGASRAAVVAGSVAELLSRLEALADHLRSEVRDDARLPPGVFYTDKPIGADTPLAFLFPGQGAQFPDMLRELAVDFPEVSEAIERADRVLRDNFDRPLSAYIMPPPMFSDEERARAAEALRSTDITQPALGACSIGMLRLLAAFGIRPAMTAGQSYGELVALHAAGCLDEGSLHRLSAARGRAIVDSIRLSESEDMGQMLAVWATEAETREVIADRPNVWIANINSPTQSVISGTTAGIDEIMPLFADAGISCKRVPVSCAFHSPMMAPAQDQFDRALAETEFTPATIPVYSNTSAEPYAAAPGAIRDLLADQLVNEVRFADEILNMYQGGARIFVEVGPNKLLCGLVRQTLADLPHAAVATSDKHTRAVTRLLMALAELYAEGIPVSLDRLYDGRKLDPRADRTPPGQPGKQPHLWVVNGSYVRPASEPPRLMNPQYTICSSQNLHSMTTESSDLPYPLPPTPQAQPAPEATSPAAPLDPQAFAAFQETMREFLRTQQAVMQAFLGQTPGVPAPDLSDGFPPTAAPPAPPIAQAPPPATLPAEPPAAAPGPASIPPVRAQQSLDQTLRALVGERTGYPEDMLDSAANLEADLGIDSIKRVEIIAAFRRQVLPDMQEPPPAFMERMTAAVSLNDILRVIEDLLGAPASAPAPTTAPADSRLDQTLIGLVADRTGYPPDMLDPDANLEADLGIDSIKRVEIIAAFRRQVLPDLQEPPSEFMERMTAAHSIRAILDVVESFLDAPARAGSTGTAQPPPPSPSKDATMPGGCPRCVVTAIPAPLDPAAAVRPPAGHWLITGDDEGPAGSVIAALERAGSTAVLLATSDLDSRESAETAIGNARGAGALAGLIHLLPSRPATAFPGVSRDEWTAHTEQEVTGLLHLLQGLRPELTQTGFRVLAVTRGGGDFADRDRDACAQPWRGGIAGLLKVAAREYPDARFHCLDIAEDVSPEMVLQEAARDSGPVEAGLRDGIRLVLQVERREWDPARPPTADAASLTNDDVVLVIGGARGITAEITHEMAQHVPCTYILLGRTALPAEPEDHATAQETDPAALRRILSESQRAAGAAPSLRDIDRRMRGLLAAREIRHTLRRLEDAGATARYEVCDATDLDALTKTVNHLETEIGPVSAVVHGAGIIEDKYISDKADESFRRVMDTKIQPLLPLTELLDPQAVKLVVLFSSTAGFFGNAGQCDYAAANETLNRSARRLADTWPARTVSLNWGPWEGAGMVTEDVARQFRERGVGLVPLEAGRKAAWQDMLHGPVDGVRILLGPGSWVDTVSQPSSAVAAQTPLLTGRTVTTNPDGSLEVRVRLDADQFRYLHDHQIDGKPVLPFAVALEMMSELAALARPDDEVVRVEDIQQFKGIVLETGPLDVIVTAHAEDSGSGRDWWRVSIVDAAAPRRKRYEARVCLASTLPPPPPIADLARIDNGFPLTVEEAYHQWLFHGAAYQLITRLDGLSRDGIDATLSPSDVRLAVGDHVSSGWLIDPMVLDTAPQLAALWARGQFDTTPLPYRVAAYERYGAIGDQPVQCYFRAAPESTGSALKAEVWFVRMEKVIGRMIGLECAGSAELNRITGKSLALR